jgi:hypothetical protein
MTLPLPIVLLLSASPVQVASAGFAGVGGVTEDTASFIAEHFANLLAKEPGLEVTTQRTVMSLLGIERQRQLLGCADNSRTCLAELTGALGAKVLLVGEVAKLDHSLQVNVRALEASTGHLLHVASVRGDSTEAVLDRLEPIAQTTASALRVHYGLEVPARAARWPALVLAGAGVAAAGVGTAFLIDAANVWARLETPSVDVSPADAHSLASSGSRSQWLGASLAGAGVVALVTGLIWFAVTGDSHVSMALSPGGAGLMVRWGLP